MAVPVGALNVPLYTFYSVLCTSTFYSAPFLSTLCSLLSTLGVACSTEVTQEWIASRVNQNIRRLQIPVCEPPGMNVFEHLGAPTVCTVRRAK